MIRNAIKPPCQRCRSAREVTPHTEHGLYVCGKCKGMSDNDPNEGGDYSDHNAGVRIERQERAKSKAK